MKPLGSEREHYWLAIAMAKSAGVDLQGAISAGRFSQSGWAMTVQRCRGCDWREDCIPWLQENPHAGAAPDSCRNAKLFATLQALQDAPASGLDPAE